MILLIGWFIKVPNLKLKRTKKVRKKYKKTTVPVLHIYLDGQFTKLITGFKINAYFW